MKHLISNSYRGEFYIYNVDLDDGLMTGIFLDQKEVRKKLRDHFAKEKDILNLFEVIQVRFQ